MLYERSEQIARLADAAAEAVAGGRVALVRGEAGIGKTSLVNAFLDESGIEPLIGWCDDASVPLLMGPFREIFEQVGVTLGDHDEARIRMGDVLEKTSCIVIEDLHWADEATLDLVAYLGRRIANTTVLLVLTLRPTDDPYVSRCLAQMPSELTLDIELQPLSESSVSAMAEATGRPAGDVYQQSAGNPFLVTEILASEEQVVPVRVLQSTLARLSRHSVQAKEVAELLSVFPAGTTWEALEQLNPLAPPALEELENGGWIASAGFRVGFRHELLRRAVEESLSSVRRRELNRDVLDVLTASGADPSTLAHHAEKAGDTQQFLEHTVGAARAFSRAGAHRDALTHLLKVEQHSSLLPDVEQARFAEALGVELLIGDRASEARSRLETASERWQRLGDIDSHARALAATSTATRRLGDIDRSIDELQQALDLLDGSTNRDLVVRTRTNMAQIVGTLSRWPEALAQVEMAMPDAVAIGGRTLAMALGIRGNARRILGDDVAGRSDHSSAIDLAVRADQEVVAMTTHMNRVAASLGTLDLAHVDDEIHEALTYSEEIQAGYGISRLRGHRCHLLELRGEWDAALATSSRLLEEVGESVALIRPRTVCGSIRVRRGDDSGLDLILQAHHDAQATLDIQRIGHTAAALAEMHWLGKVSSSEEVLRAADLATTSGHVRHAAELALWCRRLGLTNQSPSATGPEGLLAELGGDWRCAASRWQELGLPYYRTLALAFSDHAEAMTDAVVEATKLGAATTADRIRARLRELGHSVSRGPGRATLSNPAGLTNRQLEVLELVAAGFTNHEIADRLYISRKTVEHHVSAILSRLGVRDRREAGLWAIESGAVRSSHPNMGNGPR